MVRRMMVMAVLVVLSAAALAGTALAEHGSQLPGEGARTMENGTKLPVHWSY